MTSKQAGFLIENIKTLKSLAAANKIIWPKDVNSKGYKFRYVDEIDSIGSRFEHNGKKYELRYHSGCFYPYVYLID